MPNAMAPAPLKSDVHRRPPRVAPAAPSAYVRAMNGAKKDIDPDHRARRGGRGAGAARAGAGPTTRSTSRRRAARARWRPAAPRLRDHAKLAPAAPGVYRMIDAHGDVLYVGKAKNIRKRIVAYARPTGYDPRIERMIAATASLEFVSTATETEALLLEANLIKRLRPRFNVLLRDDKSFPYILITGRPLGAADPQAPRRAQRATATITARSPRSGRSTAPSRRCSARSCCAPAPTASSRAARGRACCYQIKRCSAPCTREIDFADYHGAGARGERVPLRQEPRGEGGARGRDGEGVGRARFRARRDLSRPARRALGGAVAAGHQSARRRGGRRVRRASGRRLLLRRGVLLPHRPELGQPRLFPQGRPLARGRRGAGRVPRAVLRRQAVPALHPHLARDRGARAARRGA